MKTNNRFLATTLMSAAVLGTLGVSAGAVRAVPSTHKLYVNNQPADAAAYNIEGSNYFKLRDIARLVDFGVFYYPKDNAINISPGAAYEPEEGEIAQTTVLSNAEAKPSSVIVYFGYLEGDENEPIHPTIYNINGNNYFKLRDLGELLDFNVGFTAETSRVDINTKQRYGAEPTAAADSVPNDKEGTVAQQPTTPSDKDDTVAAEPEKSVDNSPVTEADLRAWELEMVDAVNEERLKAGVPELVLSEDAMAYARYWAECCKTNYRHSVWSDIRAYGKLIGKDEEATLDALGGGENIAYVTGGNPVGHVMNLVMESPGHKATMLSTDWTHIGIGFAIDENGKIYCVQRFPRY